MNKKRRKLALQRNIAMTEGALAHAYTLIQDRDPAAIAFPEQLDRSVRDVKRKLEAYAEELKRLSSDALKRRWTLCFG